MNINRRARLWRWLLPALAPLATFVHLRVPLTTQISYIAVNTYLDPKEFNAQKAADSMLESLAPRVAASENGWIKTDYIETHWSDMGGMYISYNRKTREVRCGYDDGSLVCRAWDVSSAQLAKAAKKGATFHMFEHWSQGI